MYKLQKLLHFQPAKPSHRHYVILSLENGQLILQVRSRKTRAVLQLPTTRLNDGKWHRVKLVVSAPRAGSRTTRNSEELHETHGINFFISTFEFNDSNKNLTLIIFIKMKIEKSDRLMKRNPRRRNARRERRNIEAMLMRLKGDQERLHLVWMALLALKLTCRIK